MAGIDTATTSWGFAVTCTSGTAASTLITANATSRVLLSGIMFTGAATTDIGTVSDGAGNLIFSAAAPTTSGNISLTLAKPVPVVGLKVGIAGATTGKFAIFIANGQ